MEYNHIYVFKNYFKFDNYDIKLSTILFIKKITMDLWKGY